MLVDPKDGTCSECGGQLRIIDTDNATMTVECLSCGESYDVELDAFGDAAIHYWPSFMADWLGEGDGS